MLVLNNGMPKSGSSLLQTYLDCSVAGTCGDLAGRRVRALIGRGDLPGAGRSIRRMGDPELSVIGRVVGDDEVAVMKCHLDAEPAVVEQLRRGSIRMVCSFRDPRDVVLSAMDHRIRSLRAGGHELAPHKTLASSAWIVKRWSERTRFWMAQPGVVAISYADLVLTPGVVLGELFERIGVPVASTVIQSCIRQEIRARRAGTNQFNTGRITRFRDELGPREQRVLNRILEREITALGFEP